jgi:hypothetical protein
VDKRADKFSTLIQKDVDEEILQKMLQMERDIETESLIRVDCMRYCIEAEELERKCMAKEEDLIRRNLLQFELNRSKASFDEQSIFLRQYTRMLQSLQEKPALLERLQFAMGVQMDGGGVRAVCEDPATQRSTIHLIMNVFIPHHYHLQ